MIKDLDIKKIAIFRALQLGDMLNAVPALKVLRRAFPNAEVTLIGLPWAEAFADRYYEVVDDFISFPGFIGLPEQSFKPKTFSSFLSIVKNEEFDLGIQMHGSGSITNRMMELFGARRLAGFYSAEAHIPNEKYFMKYPDKGQESKRLLKLMDFLGIDANDVKTSFPFTEHEKRAAKGLLEKNGLIENEFICLHPGSREEARRWEAEKFAETANFITSKGYKVAFTGSEAERAYNESIAQKVGGSTTNLSGQTDLGEIAAVLKKSALLVTNDTGVAHLAAATDSRSIIIYTKEGSNIERWAPLGREQHSIITPKKAKDADNVIREINLKLREKTLQGATKNYEHARAM